MAGKILKIALGLLVASAALVACSFHGETGDGSRPMPCAKDEVYVWHDYPNTAECVNNMDHEHHMGDMTND